jgi:tripartite-type tricarboxylate transporter receptor subunit TctC
LFQDWSGLVAPAGMPPALIARANALVAEAVKTERFKAGFDKLTTDIETATPEQFAIIVTESWERYRTVVASTGFTAED